ncbi:MAG: HNH endonuclease signature motif containing protein [Pseudomonadota bacterium]|nr:HNH endonuclease signature motif containing protein [Pseudomonadota bacterium]MDQ8020127.1 HNH endonuclease signature motif containing protein [Pseudomonadota bacterium]
MSLGRIKRQQQAAAWARVLTTAASEDPICPLCGRPIPADQRDAHHLVPRSQGGRLTQVLHRICHRQLHALFTEAELAREYPTIEALKRHPAVARFIHWVQAKPPGFMEKIRRSARRR